MKSRYDEQHARAFVERHGDVPEDLALRIYTSRLLGGDASLVLHGGGNTSVKGVTRELSGEEVPVLWVKGSGWDLGSIEPSGFPACRLEALRKLCELPELSDEDMVKGLRSQMLDPSSPTPSVEALLHAFIPAKYVDHTHADAVLTVVDQPDSERRVREIWGDDALFIPYVMPGFVLCRAIVERREELASASVMILDKHGIFTWGETAKESYERMIEAVAKAQASTDDALERRKSAPFSLRPSDARVIEQRRKSQIQISTIVRGTLRRGVGSFEGHGLTLFGEWRSGENLLSSLHEPNAKARHARGTLTPDHVIRIKPEPLWLDDVSVTSSPEQVREAVERGVDAFAHRYAAYFARGKMGSGRSVTRLDPMPRIVVVPGVGALCLGKDRKAARVAGDIFEHTVEVARRADAIGEYRPVEPQDLFDVEYWSLEQAKLARGKAVGPLAGRVALVTGAASGIGRATAARFLELGAHVMVSDVDDDKLAEASIPLAERHGSHLAGRPCDVTRETAVRDLMEATVLTFGGLDIVVSNAGNAPTGQLHQEAGDQALLKSLDLNFLAHQTVARHATTHLLRQGTGGVLLFNASKSAFNQGPDFGPYAIAKAAVVALMKQYAVDLGKHGIRTGAVNADRIRTALFDGGVLEARAMARGVTPDEYFRKNLLARETTGRDVADAFAYLAQAQATTGCIITVDGGNPAAFPR